MPPLWVTLFFGCMGAVALLLGLSGDLINLRLARRQNNTGKPSMSPLVLGPLLFNWFGIWTLFLAVGGISLIIMLVLMAALAFLHVICLSGGTNET